LKERAWCRPNDFVGLAGGDLTAFLPMCHRLLPGSRRSDFNIGDGLGCCNEDKNFLDVYYVFLICLRASTSLGVSRGSIIPPYNRLASAARGRGVMRWHL